MIIPFEQPWFLLLIPMGFLAVWKLVRQKSGVGFSSILLLDEMRTRISILIWQRLLLCIFVAAAGLILAKPIRIVKTSVPVYQEARDISIILDVSGSMSQDNDLKIKTAKKVITEFVAGRPQDRIALLVFENTAYLEWPLSLDHTALISRLNAVTGGGGTTIASGIIAGLSNQVKYGESSGAMIILSDGISEISREDKQIIEGSLGKTKLYWILIGNEDQELTREFQKYVKSLGGTVYLGEADDLSEIFTEISKLESSPVTLEEKVTTTYRFGQLPLIAFVALLVAGLLEVWREVS